jgi:hypothetical protein
MGGGSLSHGFEVAGLRLNISAVAPLLGSHDHKI